MIEKRERQEKSLTKKLLVGKFKNNKMRLDIAVFLGFSSDCVRFRNFRISKNHIITD